MNLLFFDGLVLTRPSVSVLIPPITIIVSNKIGRSIKRKKNFPVVVVPMLT